MLQRGGGEKRDVIFVIEMFRHDFLSRRTATDITPDVGLNFRRAVQMVSGVENCYEKRTV